MSVLPNDIIKIIASFCDLKTLINLTQLCKLYFDILQTHIFFDYNVNFRNDYRYYNISYAHQLCNYDKLTNDDLNMLPELRYLDLHRNEKITNGGLMNLIHLTDLELSFNKKITDNGLKFLPNLTFLSLIMNRNITDNGLGYVPKLRTLILSQNYVITNKGLLRLNQLKALYLRHNYEISSECLSQITSLEYLNIIHNYRINEYFLRHLKKLRTLIIDSKHMITDCNNIKHVSNLIKIEIRYYDTLVNRYLKISDSIDDIYLSNLEPIISSYQYSIQYDDLKFCFVKKYKN